jgi:hypothetical protein
MFIPAPVGLESSRTGPRAMGAHGCANRKPLAVGGPLSRPRSRLSWRLLPLSVPKNEPKLFDSRVNLCIALRALFKLS